MESLEGFSISSLSTYLTCNVMKTSEMYMLHLRKWCSEAWKRTPSVWQKCMKRVQCWLSICKLEHGNNFILFQNQQTVWTLFCFIAFRVNVSSIFLVTGYNMTLFCICCKNTKLYYFESKQNNTNMIPSLLNSKIDKDSAVIFR